MNRLEFVKFKAFGVKYEMGDPIPKQFSNKFGLVQVRLLLLILAFLGAFASPPSNASAQTLEPAIAFAARIVGDQNRARLIVDFNRNVSFDAYVLDDPKRVVIELPETLFSLDSKTKKLPDSVVSSIRFGTIAAGQSRMVLELSTTATIEKQYVKQLSNKSRFRMIIDLVKSTNKEFVKAVRVIKAPKARVKNKTPSPQQFKIVLDPGHGGIDGGATGYLKTIEKSLVLEFALKLQEELEKDPSFNVILTRNSDSFIGLQDRIAIVRRNKADLLISIHADTLIQPNIRGATIYTLSVEGSDDLSRELAKKKTKADLVAGLSLPLLKPDVTDILIDLTRRETESYSVHFAGLMVQNMKNRVKLINNPHRSANFYILKAPEIPSILFELGYLSNREDEALMRSTVWQEQAVISAKLAVEAFFAPRRTLP